VTLIDKEPRPVHTNHGVHGSTVEVVRDLRGVDQLRITVAAVLTPAEADHIARIVAGFAQMAAAHNAGAT
jgi:NaMN:DMB phosphoribosyltransferase